MQNLMKFSTNLAATVVGLAPSNPFFNVPQPAGINNLNFALSQLNRTIPQFDSIFTQFNNFLATAQRQPQINIPDFSNLTQLANMQPMPTTNPFLHDQAASNFDNLNMSFLM